MIYVIGWAIYCWTFGLFNVRQDFRIEPVIKLICLSVFLIALFKRKEILLKIMCVVIFIVYGLFLGNLVNTIIRVFLQYSSDSSALTFSLFCDLSYKYGIDNLSGFQDVFITILPGLYFLTSLLKQRKINIFYSIFIVFFAILNLYFSIGYFKELQPYWNKWGIDLLNPIHNTVIFRILLDYIFFPGYVLCNLILNIKTMKTSTINV